MRIKIDKFVSIIILTILLIIGLSISITFNVGTSQASESQIRLLSFFGIICFAFEVLTFKYISGEWVSPYQLFFYTATLFCAGQMFGWVLGLDMGKYDLLNTVTIQKNNLYKGLIYSINGLLCVQIGAILSFRKTHPRINNEDTTENQRDIRAFTKIAGILLVISTPSMLYELYRETLASLVYGYSGLYDYTRSLNEIQRLILYPAEWFTISLLILYAANYENASKKMIYQVLMLIYIGAKLLTGGRSGAVMFILAYFITRNYLIKPYQKKEYLRIGLLGFVLLIILTAISETRLVSNRGFGDYLIAFVNAAPKALGSFIGELGWSLSSITWTTQFVPSMTGFRYGLSYLYAFTAIIPNLGFWAVHPATTYSNLSRWLQNSLGRTTGLGYTFIAESYCNFSDYGLILLLVVGAVLVKILNSVNVKTARYNYKRTILTIMIILNLLKSFVRSQFSSIMRDSVFTIGLLFFIVYLIEVRNGRKA